MNAQQKRERLGSIQVSTEVENREEDKDVTVSSFEDVVSRYGFLSLEEKEHVYAVFLNSDNTLIGDKVLGIGDRSSASVDPQDIVRTAALVNAAAIILVHNHPSGNPSPTDQDIETTEELHNLLTALGVQLLDHCIISQNEHHSMAQHSNGPFPT